MAPFSIALFCFHFSFLFSFPAPHRSWKVLGDASLALSHYMPQGICIPDCVYIVFYFGRIGRGGGRSTIRFIRRRADGRAGWQAGRQAGRRTDGRTGGPAGRPLCIFSSSGRHLRMLLLCSFALVWFGLAISLFRRVIQGVSASLFPPPSSSWLFHDIRVRPPPPPSPPLHVFDKDRAKRLRQR